MINNVETIHRGICHLGEGPVWNAQKQKLFWTDIYNKTIWVYDPSTNKSSVFWKGKYQVGGFAFTRKGNMVLCNDKGVHLQSLNHEGKPDGKPELLYDIPMESNEMFNDITVDPEGRIFAGTILRPELKNGTLYCLEKGKQPRVVLEGLHCSNGMTFSMDQKYFYHTDSARHKITRYDYDRNTGNISNPTVVFEGTDEMGSPDGITLDSQGHLWAAFWGGGCVRRISPSGTIVSELTVPAKQPSSVMFGGRDLSELYVTSAAENADDTIKGCWKDGTFAGGPVYKFNPGVAGREEWLADF